MPTPHPPPQWVWDPARKDYYWHSPTENCWIYQNGERVHQTDASTPQAQPRTPAEVPQGQSFSEAHPSSEINLSSPDYATGSPLEVPGTLASLSTDPVGNRNHVYPHPIPIRGTPGPREKLYAEYEVKYPGSRFFRRGVIFKVLWSEPAGNRIPSNRSLATEVSKKVVGSEDERYVEGRKGETIYTEFRWFVVVQEGVDCCTCLRIQTFHNNGVTGKRYKNHYAIVYTGARPPSPEQGEIARPGEEPMGEPIRVVAKNPWVDKMRPKSRINFVKLYTVEHNVKVYHFGEVDKDEEWKLITQWKKAWGIQTSPLTRPAQINYPSNPSYPSGATYSSQHGYPPAPQYPSESSYPSGLYASGSSYYPSGSEYPTGPPYPSGYGYQSGSASSSNQAPYYGASTQPGASSAVSDLTANFQNFSVSPYGVPANRFGYQGGYGSYGTQQTSGGSTGRNKHAEPVPEGSGYGNYGTQQASGGSTGRNKHAEPVPEGSGYARANSTAYSPHANISGSSYRSRSYAAANDTEDEEGYEYTASNKKGNQRKH
ncbi:hypothetical protein GQ43DRAFT_429373 [Delitschia confertaspora ATCC 74209]|uniref:DUF6590 domain-containing protein n=1 Tax=Delitschia confertaspora ATCC 74209 TaxID=1513339 RepID=A0A9P4JVK0_9PLEO|nr:hypothetical protein GQ43DRAFT_429373 [Delitschia confertaspora ATCC 74209]